MAARRSVWGWIGWVLLAAVLLQGVLVLRIAAMAALHPQSTAFQRSEAWRIAKTYRRFHWAQQWVDYDQMSPQLKRAVIASEDDSFVQHHGVDWDALQSAWSKNAQRQAQVEKRLAQVKDPSKVKPPKVVGGSTITQQLAKNLLLSGERHLWRKAEELLLTLALETFLDKRRILEIYLNSVEWGEGVFGAEAAAQRYFHKPARLLSSSEAARLAVMLPSPKFYETHQGSNYLYNRSATIEARMPSAQLP